MHQHQAYKKYIQCSLLFFAVGTALCINNCISPLDRKMAQEKVQSVSLGGISLKYDMDQGIENDPAVVFSDNFEDTAVGANPGNWDNAWGLYRIATDGEGVHSGNQALEFKVLAKHIAKSTSAGTQKYFDQGFDVLYIRYYAKYNKEADLWHGGTHNGASISARAPGVPHTSPGITADGKNKYTILLDTWRGDGFVESPGELAIYVYHPEQQHKWGEHFFPSGRILPGWRGSVTQVIGSDFVAQPDIVPNLNQWYCYELMARANTPGKRDGQISFWLNGHLVGDFPNMRLRDVETLKANQIGMILYSHNINIRQDCTMWFDDVVVATTYIGPMRK